jgi:hypothetical protein
VRVDLSLVRLQDQTRRVIASSPDGHVVGGVDIPIESPTPARTMKWAAGGLWNPADHTFGGWIDRDLGPFRIGPQIEQQRLSASAGSGTTMAFAVRVGVRF